MLIFQQFPETSWLTLQSLSLIDPAVLFLGLNVDEAGMSGICLVDLPADGQERKPAVNCKRPQLVSGGLSWGVDCLGRHF